MSCPEDSIPQLSRFSSFYSLSTASPVMSSKPEIGDINDPLSTKYSASPTLNIFISYDSVVTTTHCKKRLLWLTVAY